MDRKRNKMTAVGLCFFAALAAVSGSTLPPTTPTQSPTPSSTTSTTTTTTTSTTTTTTTSTTTTTTTTPKPMLPESGLVATSAYYYFSDSLITFFPADPDNFTTSGRQTLPYTGRQSMQLAGCALDYRSKTLFVYDRADKNILTVDPIDDMLQDEFEFTPFQPGAGIGDQRLAFDWVSKNLYWVDNGMNHVVMAPAVASKDSTLYKVILHSMIDVPVGISIDPESGYIFIVNIGGKNILRSSLTGKNPQKIVHTDTQLPYDVSADVVEKRIYWIDSETLLSADYNGGSRRHLYREYSADFVSVEVFREVVMVTEYYYGQIFVVNKTSGALLLESESFDEYWDICMYDIEAQPINVDASACSAKGCEDICVMEPPTYSATCLCREGFELKSDGRTCTEAAGAYHRALVITDGTQICLIDIRILVAFDTNYLDSKNCFYTRQTSSGNGDPSDVDKPIRLLTLRMDTRTVIFATENKIFQVSMDGQNPTPELLVSVVGTIGGISYDWLEKNVYYTNFDNGTVNVISLETSYSLVLETSTVQPRDIIVVPHYGKVFWLSKLNSTHEAINAADLTLENEEVIYADEGIQGYLVNDPIESWIFFHDEGSSYNYVRAINYTGAYLGTMDYLFASVTAYTVYKSFYIMLTHENGETEMDIGRKDSGSSLSSGVIPDIGAIVSIAVQDTNLQPSYPDPCAILNGGCEQVCVAHNASARECFCSIGSTLGPDGMACTSTPETDNFIVVADITYDTIFQIPLDETKSIVNIPHSSTNYVQTVHYNYLNSKLVYTGYDMWESYLNGSEARMILPRILGSVGSVYPRRLAVEPSTGNIYFTSAYAGLGVLTPDGKSTFFELDINSPRDIALDTEHGLMFWVDHGLSATYKGLFKAHMDGTNPSHIVTASQITLAIGIALDRDRQIVFLSDGTDDIIYTCNYDGGNFEKIHENKGASLEDLFLSGYYLYYSAWNLNYITRLDLRDITDVRKLFPNAALGRLNGMDVYQSSMITPVRSACTTDNGGCSHFCFPTPGGSSCGCEYDIDLLMDNKTCSNVPVCEGIENANVPMGCVASLGKSCEVTCAERYKLKDGVSSTLTCVNTTGTLAWNVPEPCEEITCPREIPHGNLSQYCSVVADGVCGDITCDRGHEVQTGLADITCGRDGMWSPPADTVCEEKCPDGISNGRLLECNRKTGQNCTFECDPNYRPSGGNNKIQCKANSIWSRDTDTACEEIRCTTNIPNGNLSLSCGTTIGSKCYDINCSPGHEPPAGVTFITCGPDGVWSTRAESLCEEKCPDRISNGNWVNCQRRIGNACPFQCNSGYRPRAGVNSVLCLVGSQWQQDTNGICEEVRCPDVIPHGNVSSECDRTVSSSCTQFTCDAGYELRQGGASLTCDVSGSWAGTAVGVADVCKEKCPDAIANGRLETCGRMSGDNCTFTCNITHKPRGGNSRIVCQSGSQWNRNTGEVCEAILCPTMISMTGAGQARIESNCSRGVGDRCLYSCEEGYVINVDVIHQTCQSSGQWGNTANPSGTPCVAVAQISSSQTAEQQRDAAIGATVPIIVVLALCLAALGFYIYRRRGSSQSFGTASSAYNFGQTSSENGTTSYENPQYSNAAAVSTADDKNASFHYETLDSGEVEQAAEQRL